MNPTTSHHAAEMFTWSWVTLIMCLLGLVTHLLLAWAEDRKAAKAGPDWATNPDRCVTTWYLDDPVGPTVAVVCAVAFYIALPELAQLPLVADLIGAKLGFSPLGAFGVGLGGSYLGKKLTSLFSK
jgi:hypothetical protein